MREPFDLEPEPRAVFSDDRVLVVRKPCRMHSVPGSTEGDLCAWVFERFPDAALLEGEARAREGGILHRLDFETSGLVLFARDREAKAFLESEQAEGRLRKEYRARCLPSDGLYPQGSNPPRSAPAGVDAASWFPALAMPSRDASTPRPDGALAGHACDAREEMSRSKEGRLAALLAEASAEGGRAFVECRFRAFGPRGGRVACLGSGAASKGRLYRTSILSAGESEEGLELVLRLELGFRHQIRAQLAWIGLPILGDELYGGLRAARLQLHASALVFRHPEGGAELRVAD